MCPARCSPRQTDALLSYRFFLRRQARSVCPDSRSQRRPTPGERRTEATISPRPPMASGLGWSRSNSADPSELLGEFGSGTETVKGPRPGRDRLLSLNDIAIASSPDWVQFRSKHVSADRNTTGALIGRSDTIESRTCVLSPRG